MAKRPENRMLGENVAALRNDAGMSINEAAQQLGVGRTYWYQIESGTANLTFDKLKRLAEIFDVTVRDLLTERKSSKRETVGMSKR
jgi:transcriptional regulator with XRE-family HTH domain